MNTLNIKVQTTANLWDVLCQDLKVKQSQIQPADYHLAAGEFAKAARQVFHSKNSRLGNAIEIAGDVCLEAGHWQEARGYFEEALSIVESIGPESAAARIATKLAYLFDGTNRPKSARRAYQMAMEHYEKGHDFSQHITLLSSLGTMNTRLGEFALAEKNYQQALAMAQQLHGEDSPSSASVLTALGLTYFEAGEYVKAENAHMRALSIREKSFGAFHPDVAQSLAHLAVVYHVTNQPEKARKHYIAAFKIYRRFKTPDSEEVTRLVENMQLAGVEPPQL